MDEFSYRSGQLFCEGVSVDALALEHGTPLYIYSRNAIERKYRAAEKAFSGVDALIAFSVKSCSSLGVLNVLRALGSGFDIVSGGELARALRVGADPRKIVFAGVGKTEDELRAALDNDILMLNVESEAELDAIQAIAAEMGTVAPVALRLNPDVDAKTNAKTTTGKKENKFGIDFPTASRLVRNIAVQPNVRLLGLDVHIGSPVWSTAPYAEALEKVSDFIRDHRSPRAQFEYLNAGGGFGLLYRDQTVPSFQEYADAIVPFAKRCGCRLIVEPGRSIAGNAALLVTKVLYLKDNGARHFTIVDAGMNDLVRPALYGAYHFIWPTRHGAPPPAHLFGGDGAAAYFGREDAEREGILASRDIGGDGLVMTDVVGPICESSDCFAEKRRLPLMERGRCLAIFSAGAYGFSMAGTYNSRPRPPEILVEGGEARVIRRRESVESLMSGESI